MSRLEFLKEIWAFLKVRKKWWLWPVVLLLVLLAGLIVYVFSSSVAPVLYPLF